MKILQITSGYPPVYRSGGASQSAQELSESLVNRDHSVTIYTTNLAEPDNNSIPSKNVINGVQIKRFKNLSTSLAYTHKIPIAPTMARAIYRKRNDFDLAHIHEFRTIQAASLQFSASSSLPYVFQPRGEVPRKSKSKMKFAFDSLFGKRIMRNASAIIASSKTESSQYTPTFDESEIPPKFYVPNGIDTSKYQPTEPDKAFKDKFGLSESSINILFLSRISERKGVSMLVRAFNEIKGQYDDVQLILAGPDEGELPTVRKWISKFGLEDAVNIVGPVYGDEKFKLYSFADLFVLPSKNKYESFGRVVLEAIACGTPVVVTNVCGVSEWLETDQMLVAEPTEGSLVQQLRLALFEQEIHHSQMDIDRALEGLSWDEVAAATEDVYESVLSNK